MFAVSWILAQATKAAEKAVERKSAEPSAEVPLEAPPYEPFGLLGNPMFGIACLVVLAGVAAYWWFVLRDR